MSSIRLRGSICYWDLSQNIGHLFQILVLLGQFLYNRSINYGMRGSYMALAKGTPILVGGRKCFEFVHEMVLVQPDPDSYFLHKPTHPQDCLLYTSREDPAWRKGRKGGRGEGWPKKNARR